MKPPRTHTGKQKPAAKPGRRFKPRTAKPKHRAIAAWNATLAQRLGQK